MTTLTNSEGKLLNCSNEFIETILLPLNPSNNYYTTGDDDIMFIKIGSTKLFELLIVYYTYHINRTMFQNYTVNDNLVTNCDYNLFQIIQVTNTNYNRFITVTHTLELLLTYHKYFWPCTIQEFHHIRIQVVNKLYN